MTLRAGIIGLGVGQRHLAAYQSVAGCEVAALCDLDPVRLAEVAAGHPGIRATTCPEDVLEDPDIDIVSVASYDDAHAGQIVRAIDAGKHVFAEKPLCLHRHELAAIAAALAARPTVRLSSNLVLRTCPRFAALRRLVRGGNLGEVYYLEADYNYGRIHKIIDGWRGRLPYYSVFLGGAVHMVDLLTWLTGWRVAEVSARGSNRATRQTDFQYNDLTVALLTFENGAMAKVAANFACVTPHFHRLMVYADAATFEHCPEHGRIVRSRQAGAPPQLLTAPYPGQDKGEALRGFVTGLLTGGPLPDCVAGAAEVLDGMAVCFAVEQSVSEGRSIPINYNF